MLKWGVLVAMALVAGCFSEPPTVAPGSSTTGTSSGEDGSTSPTMPMSGSGSSATPMTSDGTEVTTTPLTTGSTGPALCDPDCFTGRCTEDGQCIRYVFVTEAAYESSLDGRGGADAACNDEAQRNDLLGDYRALLAVDGDTGGAFEWIGWDDVPGARFVLVDDAETLVADDPSQLRADDDGSEGLFHEINYGPSGMPIADESTACADLTARVWTGMSRPEAMGPVGGAGDCGDWTGANMNGGTGRFIQSGPSWLGSSNCPCMTDDGPAITAHLYCFESP